MSTPNSRQSEIGEAHWRCPECGTFDGPITGDVCDVCGDDHHLRKVEKFVRAEATRRSEIAVTVVSIPLCDLCLDGAGGECHAPGCALWMKPAPDVEIRSSVVHNRKAA